MEAIKAAEILVTLFYVVIGVITFLSLYIFIEKIAPFDIRKEIVEDQNVALGIVLGLAMLGLAIIIAASIHS